MTVGVVCKPIAAIDRDRSETTVALWGAHGLRDFDLIETGRQALG